MRVPLSWLRDYVDVELSPHDLAEQLTVRGMEVQAIEVAGAGWTDVVVGRLLSVERHPNADKLWLTSVDVGGDEPLQVVCGADNIAPGQLVPVARVGAVLPGERRIERTKIRGVESQGMLCSAIELGLGDDAEGIHILGGEEDRFDLGADLATIVGEVVLDVDVKPNRGFEGSLMIGWKILAGDEAGNCFGVRQMPATEVVKKTVGELELPLKNAPHDVIEATRWESQAHPSIIHALRRSKSLIRLVSSGLKSWYSSTTTSGYSGMSSGDSSKRRSTRWTTSLWPTAL